MKTPTMDQVVASRMAANKAEISRLEKENEVLRHQWRSAVNVEGINKWKGFRFESSSGLTPEFAAFARDFKKHILSILPAGIELGGFSRGHFECSGFIRFGEKYVYFSVSDVRFSPDEWNTNILVRTAKHDKDYTGGKNCYTTLEKFASSVASLLKE